MNTASRYTGPAKLWPVNKANMEDPAEEFLEPESRPSKEAAGHELVPQYPEHQAVSHRGRK